MVIVNGGLGPTSDDLTAEAAALSANTQLELYPEWVERIQQMFDSWGREMPESNIKQAMLPQGSTILDNPRGTACGFTVNISGAQCYFTPGVPHEFKTMVNQEIIPHMQANHACIEAKKIHRLFTYGLSESGIANTLEPLSRPQGVTLGYRSALPYIEVKVFYNEFSTEVEEYVGRVEQLLIDNTVSTNCHPVKAVFDRLQQRVAIFDGVTQGFFHSWLAESTQGAANLVSVNQSSDELLDFGLDIKSFYSLNLQQSGEKQWQLKLKTQNNILSQTVEFKRDYSFKARSVVISAIALDMLRRDVNELEPWGNYGSVVRLSSEIVKL